MSRTAKVSTRWADKYMGVPFKDGGRDWRGADCLGLYAIVLAKECGCSLPAYDVSYGADAAAVVRRIEAEIASGAWRLIVGGDGSDVKPRGRAFDAVRMEGHIRLPGGGVIRGDVHIGIALGDGRMLHTEPGTGPQIIALDDARVVKRVKGLYRPTLLDCP